MLLKLAEYNAEGKFERFLELGKDFGYGGNYIELKQNFMQRGDIRWTQNIEKDEKDPLNRFNGLFDGRTYGEGRFVLMRGYVCHCCGLYLFWEDKIYFDGAKDILLKFNGIRFDPVSKLNLNFSGENIHEKPELWEKVR